jgi:hypothetical protein
MKLSTRGIVGLISVAVCASPAFSTEDGWKLFQSAKGGAALSGSMTLYITSGGMRTYEPKNGISLMTHGPNWNIYIYNEKTRRMFVSQLQPWLESFKKRGLAGRFQGATWKRGGQTATIAGARAYQFMMDKAPVVQTTSKALNGKMKSYSALRSASLWVASDIQTPPQVSNILSQIYGVPDCQRIPLRVVVDETAKGQSTAVDTLTASHITVADSTFAVPTGYQITKTDSDVFIDKESADTLDEMLNDLDSPGPAKSRPAPAYQRQPAYQQRPGQPVYQQRPGQPVRR